MNTSITQKLTEAYHICGFDIKEYQLEPESTAYGAARFKLDEKFILSRNSKITPKKVGQFVTFWKRNKNKNTAPFDTNDGIDFYVINCKTESKLGQFVFPKSVLIEKGLISSSKKEGKRGFRVYPKWDTATNTQAKKTQSWQLDYFYEITNRLDPNIVAQLYLNK